MISLSVFPLLLVLIFPAHSQQQSNRACAPGWENLGSKCFYFSRRRDGVLGATGGESKCKSLHPAAHLASVTSQEEQDLIESNIKGGRAWIGGTDERSQGVWEWTDGSPWGYENWRKPSEPNNLFGNEDCTIIWGRAGKWFDVRCEGFFEAGYVCSYNLNDIDRPLELEDGRKFFCVSGNMNREGADSHCRDRGLVLPIVKELTTVEKILKHCDIKDYAFWVDAVREPNSNLFKWSSGSIIDNKDPNWHNGNPSYDGTCIEWLLSGGKWALNDVYCGVKRWVVCEQRTQ